MTDTSQNTHIPSILDNMYIPDDVWAIIFNHFSLPEVIKLKTLSKSMTGVFENLIIHKLNEAQKTEIAYLHQHHKNPVALAQFALPAKNLTDLKTRNDLLNQLNSDIIEARIALAKAYNNADYLGLDNTHITRFPAALLEKEELQGYWGQLKGVNLGSNQLQALPVSIGNLVKLKSLNLENNQLQDYQLPENLRKRGFALGEQRPRPEPITPLLAATLKREREEEVIPGQENIKKAKITPTIINKLYR